MSLPLSRRIARAALLVAAGATPLAAAGAASAAELLPHSTDLGSGISKLDGVTSASTLRGEAHNVGEVLGTTGALVARTAIPAAADAVGMAAADTVPGTDQATQTLANPTAALNGATTDGSGPLADTLSKVTRLTPLGHLLPASHRAMPFAANPAAGLAHAPKMPTVNGVEKLTGELAAPDTLNNPLGAAGRLAREIPATSGLADQLPTRDQVAGALPSADRLAGALATTDLSSAPSTTQLGNAVPDTAPLAGALPATHGLANDLTAADQLTHGLPTADLAHPADAVDTDHLASLAGRANGATHRLSTLPDLGAVTSVVTGVTGVLHHLPSAN
jgi:hypothetical protein